MYIFVLFNKNTTNMNVVKLNSFCVFLVILQKNKKVEVYINLFFIYFFKCGTSYIRHISCVDIPRKQIRLTMPKSFHSIIELFDEKN